MEPPREKFLFRRTDYLDAFANASGVASGSLLEVPIGYHEKIERISTWGNSAASALPLFEVFLLSTGAINSPGFTPDRTRRVEWTDNAINDIADEDTPIYVDNGLCIFGYWTGANNNDHFQASFQVSVWEKWPFLGHREMNHYAIRARNEGAEWKINKGAWVFEQDPAIEDPHQSEKQGDIEHVPFEPYSNGRGSIIKRATMKP